MRLLDPKNDFVFKRLFADDPELLAALINAVRSTELPVEAVEVLNPRIEPEELTGKFIVLDILARNAQGRRYDIEMQVRPVPGVRAAPAHPPLWPAVARYAAALAGRDQRTA